MERVIRLKSMITSMTNEEYVTFIERVTSDKTTFTQFICDIATSALSPSFLPQKPIIYSHMDHINQTASEILECRQSPECKSNVLFEPILSLSEILDLESSHVIHELPSDIIVSVARFLSLPDQSRLALCSKTLMMSIRSAPIIRHLDDEESRICAELSSTYTALCWNVAERLRHLESLELDLSHDASTHFCMTDEIPVTSLTLYNFSHNFAAQFFEINPDLSQIKRLTLDERDWMHYEDEVVVEPLEVVITTLSSCSSLESLSLGTCGSEIEIDPMDDMALNVATLESLDSLTMFSSHYFHPDIVPHQVLQRHGHRLESLHLHHVDGAISWRLEDDDDYYHYDLSNVVELCLGSGRQMHDLEVINKSGCNQLKRIRIESDAEFSGNQERIKSLQKVDHQLVTVLKKESIEYIDLSIHDMSSLVEAVKVKRHRLKVRIHSNVRSEEVITEQLLECLNVMNQYCEDWMFIVAMDDEGFIENEKCKTIMDRMEEWMFSVTINTGYQRATPRYQSNEEYDHPLKLLVISKADCKIQGYREQWMLTCKGCCTSHHFVVE